MRLFTTEIFFEFCSPIPHVWLLVNGRQLFFDKIIPKLCCRLILVIKSISQIYYFKWHLHQFCWYYAFEISVYSFFLGFSHFYIKSYLFRDDRFRWPANNGQRTKDSNTIMITMDEQTNGQFIRKFSPNRLIVVFDDVRWHYGSN